MEPVNQEEEMTLAPNQVCIATDHFDGQEDEDLKFSAGERIIILRPTEVMFWYIAKNERGDVGTVPATHLTPVTEGLEDGPPPVPPKPTNLSKISPDPLPPKPASLSKISPDPLPPKPANLSKISPDPLPPKPKSLSKISPDPEDYEKMGPSGAASRVQAGNTKSKSKPKPLTDEEKEIMRIMEREKQRRYAKGTLVVATATFRAEKFQDMPFKVHEEMILLEPMPDLCWYYAQKVENPSKKGVIPITHVRLVYMSDDEDEDEGFYNKPTNPGHERLYDDRNDFITRSGWFSFSGLALGKEAQLNVLARKAKMNYEDFMAITKAVYMFSYRQEKVFVGKADVLSEELMKHFDNFGKPRKQICEIDDELCHHTEASGWDLKVWPVGPEQNLELEWTKKIIENDALSSSDGAGVNEYMSFTSMDTFNTFWEWLSPN